MKKMIYFAAFAIMMAMGNMNAYAKVGAKHNEIHMNDKGVVMAYHGDHHDMHVGKKLSKHELRMIEKRRRMEVRRRIAEARHIEEMRRMEAARRHHHAAHHHHEVVVVDNNVAAGVAGVAAGVAVVAFVSALMH